MTLIKPEDSAVHLSRWPPWPQQHKAASVRQKIDFKVRVRVGLCPGAGEEIAVSGLSFCAFARPQRQGNRERIRGRKKGKVTWKSRGPIMFLILIKTS